MRNAGGQQGEASKVRTSCSGKKKRTGTQAKKNLCERIRHFSPIKCVTRKFHVVAVQSNGKEMYKFCR